MRNTTSHNILRTAVLTAVCMSAALVPAQADVYINVMAVNGASEHKETPVKFDLPGDLKAEDIVDTDGLQLDYDVNNANYVVSGNVSLESKASKTFRIRVKDIWKVTPEQADQMKAEIEKGFEQVGKLHDAQKGELLKQQLLKKMDTIVQAQTAKAESVERRIDSFRAYNKEMQHIKDQALAVDYWRSEPGQDQDKVFRLKVTIENSATNTEKKVKQKVFLPAEIKPQDVVDDQGFEVRFDEPRQQAFLFKEDEMAPGEKKDYSVGLRDIWFVPQRDIDYLRKRADYAYEYLQRSKYDQSAKFLYEQAGVLLKGIEESQKEEREIKEHISAFRANQKSFSDARTDVENLEKLLSLLREDLEKSKVENVLQKVRSLKGVAGVAQQMFDKKPTQSTAWKFIGWILLFVGVITLINFMVWLMRSKDKKKNMVQGAAPPPTTEEKAPAKK